MKHLLLIRLSALGDVLMTVPAVLSLAHQFPEMKITVAGPPVLREIFLRLPDNVNYVGINKRDYSGLRGLYRLYRELMDLHPTHVCDLHDVIRTKVLRFFFNLSHLPVTHIRKDRKAQKRFLNSRPPVQQETTFERYRKALERLGFPVDYSLFTPFTAPSRTGGIGVAPFAAHPGKVYPLEQMELVVRGLAEQGKQVYIFGAGKEEKEKAEAWADRYPGVESMVGKLGGMAQEMDFIARLDVMISMDSANMHLASLTDTPVISLWGATHPLGGFLGWGQSMENVIQTDDMDCRPCSIYGKTKCLKGNYPCLNRITPERIIAKVNELCG